MKSTIFFNFVVVIVTMRDSFTSAAPAGYALASNKVFNYQGPLQIKDDKTGEIIKSNATETLPTTDQPADEAEDNEAACWEVIVKQSGKTFALQSKVLDELEADMKELDLDANVREAVERLIKRMRKGMSEALDALTKEDAENYFDNLFDASEAIIQLSGVVRNPQLDDTTFLALIKAVARLGRNNSALIQEFTNVCASVQRSPRARSVGQ